MSDFLIDTLESKLPSFEVNSWNQTTAKDMINTWRNGKMWNGKSLPAGRFSDKQRSLVQTLIARADNTPAAADTINVGSYDRVCKMFESAKTRKLKFPKIELLLGTVRVRLYMATNKSRTPGHIQVKGEARFFGNVSPAGDFAFYTRTEKDEELVSVLTRFGANPVGVAAEYGKITGNCCFCRKPLGEGEDKRSVKNGYGPVCAKKWDLPWR